MKEFDLPIATRKGLVPDSRIGRGFGREFASELNRLAPYEFGLREPVLTELNATFSPSVTVTWPFPQVIPQHDRLLLFDATSVSIITEGGSWTVAAETLVDFFTLASTTISSGDPWDGTLHAEAGIFTNGTNVVVMDNALALTGQANQTRVADVQVNSICSHDGRIIYGGLAPADVWSDDWKAIFEEYVLKSPLQFNYEQADEIEQNFIFWTGIRNGTDYFPIEKPDAAIWQEAFRSQQAGFAPTPTRGSVLRVLPFGRGFVAYTTDGVYLAEPLVAGDVLTYGFRTLLTLGVYAKMAVAGTRDEHVFADERGDLYRLSGAGSLEKLGYRSFISNLDTAPIFTYNPLEDEYWLAGSNTTSGDSEAYVLRREGLGFAFRAPTSLYVSNGQALALNDAAIADPAVTFVTENLDFNYRDLKTITTVEVGFEGDVDIATDGISVAVDYRYNSRDPWVRSSFTLCNLEGFARVQITALEFRVVVSWAVGNETNPVLDYLNVKWQAVGRRTVRGVTSASASVG